MTTFTVHHRCGFGWTDYTFGATYRDALVVAARARRNHDDGEVLIIAIDESAADDLGSAPILWTRHWGCTPRIRKTRDIDHTGAGGPVRVPRDMNRVQAAGRAARVLARREFGKRGEMRILRLDSWAMDGSSETYEAFIGTSERDGFVGRNITIYA